MLDDGQKFPCPCCGYRVFRLPPGCHEGCPICGWEDDMAQLRFARMAGSANRVSLLQAQANFVELGRSEQRPGSALREVCATDRRDPEWRPLQLGRDYIEEPQRGIDYAVSYPLDTTVLYYWRSNFWHSQLA